MKITLQRKALLDVFDENKRRFITIKDIEKACKDKYPDINLSTIYRNIELFLKNGLVSRALLKNDYGYKFFCKKKHHHHMICTKCGVAIPFSYCPINEDLKKITEEENFYVKDHRFEIFGICKKCKKAL